MNQFVTGFSSDSSSSNEDEEVVPQSAPLVPPTPALNASIPAVSNRTLKVKKTVSKIPKPILHVKNVSGKQSQGNRQARRHENSLFSKISPKHCFHPGLILVCFLLNLAADLDEDFAEVNINDLVETTISAFAQLLLSKNKMKVSPLHYKSILFVYIFELFYPFYSLYLFLT